VELFDNFWAPLRCHLGWHAVYLEVSVEAVKGQEVVMMGVDVSVGKGGDTCCVVFMGVGDEHAINLLRCASSLGNGQGRVDQHGFFRSDDHERVAVGIPSVIGPK
jgi:hypothetical protein